MAPNDPRIGTSLGGYEIESLLGRGGMGVVYLARDAKLGRRVALKVLTPEFAEDESFRNRFVRESQMAAATDHPNIIPVYDTGEAEGVLFLAMRYVEGTDLRRVIQEQGQLELGRAVSIVGQIGSALDAAHARGLIHRDVKPANVLMTTLGSSEEPLDHVYLTDFGLTKRSDSRSKLTETGGFMGTIDYMAPEQIEGKELDGGADLYALGCLFYECLTGVVPYERDSDVAVMYAHLMDERPLVSATRPDIPAGLDGIVARSMSKDPAERFPNAAAMVAETRRALGMSGAIDAPSGAHRAPGRKEAIRKVPGGRVGAIAIGVTLVIALAAFFLSRPDPKDGSPASSHGKPTASPEQDPAAGPWQPTPGSTFQLQLSGRLDTSYEADVYDVDLFDTSDAVVGELKSLGRRVVCYLSAGAWEEWRPDADAFPPEVIGPKLQGSASERWLDIRALDTLRPLMERRLDICAEKGFDGVEFDNNDGFANRSGFDLSAADQIAFSEMLAELAHERGLAAGLKNAPAIAADLEEHFDFAVNTGCYQYEECDSYDAFVDSNKPVFVIEFELELADFCGQAEADGFTAQRKRYNLGAWRQGCWE